MSKFTGSTQRHAIGEVPHDLPVHHRKFFTEIRNAIVQLQGSKVPPRAPTNLAIVPIAGGNAIQFTRSDGDYYRLYVSNSPDFGAANVIDLGDTGQYSHVFGEAAITKFYWVKAFKSSGMPSDPAGPLSGTSLALNTGTTVPTPPPGTDTPSEDTFTGKKAELNYGP